MILQRTEHFLRAYQKLDKQRGQPLVDKALRLLAQDPHYPSLRLEKIAPGIWSIRASLAIRITFGYEGELAGMREGEIELRNVGTHDVYKNP